MTGRRVVLPEAAAVPAARVCVCVCVTNVNVFSRARARGDDTTPPQATHDESAARTPDSRVCTTAFYASRIIIILSYCTAENRATRADEVLGKETTGVGGGIVAPGSRTERNARRRIARDDDRDGRTHKRVLREKRDDFLDIWTYVSLRDRLVFAFVSAAHRSRRGSLSQLCSRSVPVLPAPARARLQLAGFVQDARGDRPVNAATPPPTDTHLDIVARTQYEIIRLNVKALSLSSSSHRTNRLFNSVDS